MGGLPEGGTQRAAISDELARALVSEQYPHLANLEVGRRYVFDDHVTIRFGDRLSANFPTTADLDPLIVEARRWLVSAAADWDFPASLPLHSGEPSGDYPYHWEITPWLPGSNATIVALTGRAAPELGKALRQVHRKAPKGAPRHSAFVEPLASLRGAWEGARRALASLRGPRGETVETSRLDDAWEAAVEADPEGVPRWTHGNLDPRYVVSDRGHFRGICSWFTFGAGDPASDLGAACLLLPIGSEERLLDGYGPMSDAMRDRACGYRLLRAAQYATSTNPFLWRIGWDRLVELERNERSSLRRTA